MKWAGSSWLQQRLMLLERLKLGDVSPKENQRAASYQGSIRGARCVFVSAYLVTSLISQTIYCLPAMARVCATSLCSVSSSWAQSTLTNNSSVIVLAA